MKHEENQSISLKCSLGQLDPERQLRSINRPFGGWLRAIRQALGRTLKSVARDLKVTPQAIHQLEKSEAAGSISLRQLELIADAMGCRVVYALISKERPMADSALEATTPAAELSAGHDGSAYDRREAPV
jgi:transcriptional regulator with XRE-family HTH domain